MAVMGLTASDRLEIAELLARYAAAVDDGDFAAVGELFAGGELQDADGRVVASGAGAVTELFASTTRRHDSGTPETVHLVTNVVVEPHPDGPVVVRSRFLVLQQVASGALEPIVTGRYEDRVDRDDASDQERDEEEPEKRQRDRSGDPRHRPQDANRERGRPRSRGRRPGRRAGHRSAIIEPSATS